MSAVGDTLSTLESAQYIGGDHEYTGDLLTNGQRQPTI